MQLNVFEYSRPVRWSDLDPAGIVYFPRFFEFCHETLESLFSALPGGYPALTMQRRIGVPTVHLEADFRAPLRYGETCVVRTVVTRVGRTSISFTHTLTGTTDGGIRAVITHVIAVTDLVTLRAIEIPADMRAVLTPHLEMAG